MNFMNKKQPPKALGIIALESVSQLVTSSFMTLALKKQFPQIKVYLVTRQEFVHAKSVLHYDAVWGVHDKSLDILWQGIRSKILGVELFLDLQAGPHFLSGKFKNTVVMPKFENSVEDYIRLLSLIGIEAPQLNMKLKVNAKTYIDVKRYLLNQGLKLGQFITVALTQTKNETSFFKNKNWPYVSEFLKLCAKSLPYQILILGEQGVMEIPDKNVVFISKKMSLEEGLVIINESKAFVGIDQVWARVAAQLETPSVLLYGPSYFNLIAPNMVSIKSAAPCSPCQRGFQGFDFGCQDNICMKTHSPQNVLDVLKSLIHI